MTTGTKVFLAVFALFVGVMVLYYGVLMPSGNEGGQPEAALATKLISPSGAEIAPKAATNHERAETSRISPSEPTPSLPHTLASEAVVDQPEAVGEVPVGLDPTRMLPLMNVDELPALEAEQHENPAEVNSPEAPEKARPPAVRPNTPVTLDPALATQPLRTRAVDPKAQPKSNSATKVAVNPPAPKTTEYIVKSGDTMVTIAKQWFGDESKWSLIAKTNPWVDPARMQIGQKLQLPAKDAKPEPIKVDAKAPKSDKSVYIVRSGDTLARIAREFYGSIAKWEMIYEANKAVIGDDPAALQVGMKLTLPKA
jgi:nucleoid-associated protein YgaU